MLSRRPGRLTYANVVSSIALFLALSMGTAYAANTVFSSDIVNGEVKAADLANSAVTSAKLGANSVGSGKVLNGTLRTADLADGAATGAKIEDNSITGADVGDGTITGADVENFSITGGDLAGSSLTGVNVANNTLTGDDIDESTLGQVPSAALGGVGRFTANSGGCDPESETYVDCGYTTLALAGNSRVLIMARISAVKEVDADNGFGYCRLVTSVGAVPNTDVFVDSYGSEDYSLLGVTGVLGPGTYDFGIECSQSAITGAIAYYYAQVTAVALSPN